MKKEVKIIICIIVVLAVICGIITSIVYSRKYNSTTINLDVDIMSEDGNYYSEAFTPLYKNVEITANSDASLTIQNVDNKEDIVVIESLKPSEKKKVKLDKSKTYVAFSDVNIPNLRIEVKGVEKNTDRTVLNKINNEIIYSNTNTETINNIDNFYNLEITKDKDVRNIPQNYSLSDAQKDGAYVIDNNDNNDEINKEAYDEFMAKYNNNEDAFLRIARATIEGDVIIYDVLCHENKFYLIVDTTRDKYAAIEDQKVSYFEYEKMGTTEADSKNYWILYNGEVPQNLKDANIPDELYVLAVVE